LGGLGGGGGGVVEEEEEAWLEMVGGFSNTVFTIHFLISQFI